MRTFTCYRRGDLSATHDSNQANPPDAPQFEGVIFSDGTTVIRWLTAARSTGVFVDFDTLMKIHGHTDPQSRHGTEIVFTDSLRRPQQITCGVCGTMYTSPTGSFLRCPTCPQ